MQIAVLSGKGGTGKTFVSVNLAYTKGKAIYMDCDIEEPNGRLFLKPQEVFVEKVNAMVPAVDAEKCTGCRKCVELCKFNALAYIKNKLLIFPELCHACGGCILLCPQAALSESGRYIGCIEHGMSGGVEVITGVLNTGEATGVPIIRELLSGLNSSEYIKYNRQYSLQKDRTVIIDCPPGSACSVMESIKGADFCLMVAEPTAFGIHNLNMVYKLVKLFGKPCALIINKDLGDRSLIHKFCSDNDIKVITSIPYDTELAQINSNGLIVVQESERYRNLFKGILEVIEKEVLCEAIGNIKR